MHATGAWPNGASLGSLPDLPLAGPPVKHGSTPRHAAAVGDGAAWPFQQAPPAAAAPPGAYTASPALSSCQPQLQAQLGQQQQHNALMLQQLLQLQQQQQQRPCMPHNSSAQALPGFSALHQQGPLTSQLPSPPVNQHQQQLQQQQAMLALLAQLLPKLGPQGAAALSAHAPVGNVLSALQSVLPHAMNAEAPVPPANAASGPATGTNSAPAALPALSAMAMLARGQQPTPRPSVPPAPAPSRASTPRAKTQTPPPQQPAGSADNPADRSTPRLRAPTQAETFEDEKSAAHKRMLQSALEAERKRNPQHAHELESMIEGLQRRHEAVQRFKEQAAQQPSLEELARMRHSLVEQNTPAALPTAAAAEQVTSHAPATLTATSTPAGANAGAPGAQQQSAPGATSKGDAGAVLETSSAPPGAMKAASSDADDRVMQLRSLLLQQLAGFKAAPHTAAQVQSVADVVANALQELRGGPGHTTAKF